MLIDNGRYIDGSKEYSRLLARSFAAMCATSGVSVSGQIGEELRPEGRWSCGSWRRSPPTSWASSGPTASLSGSNAASSAPITPESGNSFAGAPPPLYLFMLLMLLLRVSGLDGLVLRPNGWVLSNGIRWYPAFCCRCALIRWESVVDGCPCQTIWYA